MPIIWTYVREDESDERTRTVYTFDGRVYDYATGVSLSGRPSRELREMSEAAGPTGAVCATTDGTGRKE